MKRAFRVWALLPALAVGCMESGGSGVETGISPERVADFLYTVIEADRATYATEVVERLQDRDGVLEATEHFREEKTLPLPAQMLRMGALRASERGGFRYALVSPWALNKANLPKTDFERAGLNAVIARPDRPYTAREKVNGRWYFLALYPDRAVSPACVKCHNEHEESPRRDFEEGDVMGGVVLTIPLDGDP